MVPGHGLKPGETELRGRGIRIRQAVLEICEHLRVVVELSHLGSGHQHCSDPPSYVLHLTWKTCSKYLNLDSPNLSDHNILTIFLFYAPWPIKGNILFGS